MGRREQWRAVLDYPGYEVSNQGRVRSLDREVPLGRGGFSKMMKGKILSQGLVGGSKQGGRYYACVLFLNGKRKTRMVHTLMLEAFVEPRPEGKLGCHKDDDPRNNVLENLYWGTPTQNVQDAVRSGRHASAVVAANTHCFRGHEYTSETMYIRPGGYRECRICHCDDEKARYRRRKGH